jgi:hypothetical protein
MAATISYGEFLDLLRNTPRIWYLEGTAIRCGRRSDYSFKCPLLYTTRDDVGNVIGNSIYWEIARAADGDPKSDRNIRTDLLTACGLAEVSS